MHITFAITGQVAVPAGTRLLPGATNLFQLPGGQVISVHPVIEAASHAGADDHRDLTSSQAYALGVCLALYDRNSELECGG
jgi:hypothetical protein